MSEVSDSPERRERKPPKLDALSENLHDIAVRAEKLGVAFSGLVTDENLIPLFAYQENRPSFAAGQFSVSAALMAVYGFTPEHVDYLKEQGDDVEDYLYDILAFSDNNAFRNLAQCMGGPDNINYFLSKNARQTRVAKDPYTGRTVIGDTTPAESLFHFRTLISNTEGNQQLKEAAISGLRETANDRYGMRQVLHSGISLDKSGEYNGDTETPAVRNATGLIVGAKSDPSLLYSFMTSGPEGKSHGWLQDQIVAQACAEVLFASGNSYRLHVGYKALQATGVYRLAA